MRTAPISSATARRRAADELGARYSRVVVSRQHVRPVPSLAPTHPGKPAGRRRPARATAGPDTRRCGRPAAARTSGPGGRPAVRTGDELDLALAVGVAVALLVRAVERLGELAPQRHGQLERLACVAQVRLAVAPAARRPPRAGTTYERTRVAPLVARHEPERRQHAGAVRARARVAIPSSSASSQACSGPAPPNATSAKSARIVPALDRDEPQRAQHLGVHAPRRPRPGRCRSSARSAASRSSSSPPASRVRQPPEQEVRVGHRRPRRRRGRSRPVPDRRPRSRARRAARRPRRARRSSRRRRRRSAGRRVGSRTGNPPTVALATLARGSPSRSGRRPSTCRPCRARSRLDRPAAQRRARAPTAPAAGPETQRDGGMRRPPRRSSRRRPTSA